ncbi:hypothetical protein [Streptomyces smyrnaeus]|uniref:hypothetical protein n=1 Tax=Streptomyces smyrnaeus TaxID=1387713 RepID=UPI0036CD579E
MKGITDAMVCLLIGTSLHSDGKLTIVSLAVEAGLRRNELTHKHTGLKDLFYALIKARGSRREPVCEAVQARGRKQQEDLVRVRAERDELRFQAQLLARIVQVLEFENHRLKETNAGLEQQLAARVGVPGLAGRCQPRPCISCVHQRRAAAPVGGLPPGSGTRPTPERRPSVPRTRRGQQGRSLSESRSQAGHCACVRRVHGP